VSRVPATSIHIPPFAYPSSELTMAQLPFTVNNQGEVEEGAASVTLRIDRAIIYVGFTSILLLVALTVLPGIGRESALRDVRKVALSSSVTRVKTRDSASSNNDKPTAVDLFAVEVAAASNRADTMFSRSTLLLSGGIVMAFIGVAIFYLTLPETAKDEGLASYLPKVVRPTGVLIFVEAIAWFLLRQYRALIEDYKSFYRLYLKRANYLAAIRILSAETVRPEDLFMVVSLVQEDLSARLKVGETTESLEALRSADESPVSDLIRAFAGLKAKASAIPAKAARAKAAKTSVEP
jgi:hypothetical protein